MTERLYHLAAAPFAAARRVSILPGGHRSRRLHGQSCPLRLHLTAPQEPVLGWTVDYGDVKDLFEPVHKQLDHHLLNELPRLEDADPASLARWVREEAAAGLPQLERIDLRETPGCGAVLCWGDLGPALPS
jgi:6-pyruvoyltetrahydropterin/6-carboxytetrahydropterin synthase